MWFFLFLAIALLSHFFVPATHVFDISDMVLGKVVGVILFVIGMGLSLQASKIFAEENTEILPTSPTNRVLVTRGPFRFSRNPMYLGMVLSLLGIGFFMGTLPVFFAALAQCIVLNFFFIPFEEQKMERQFGEQYIAYRNSVRRWL